VFILKHAYHFYWNWFIFDRHRKNSIHLHIKTNILNIWHHTAMSLSHCHYCVYGDRPTRPHLTGPSSFALAAHEAASWLQAGDPRVQVAAWSNSNVPGWRLPTNRRLRTPPALLGWCQRAQCSEDTQSTRRQEFLGRGSKGLEQSACSTATAGRRIQTVQATFKVISFWRDRGTFVTFCFQCAVYKLIYLLTYLHWANKQNKIK